MLKKINIFPYFTLYRKSWNRWKWSKGGTSWCLLVIKIKESKIKEPKGSFV